MIISFSLNDFTVAHSNLELKYSQTVFRGTSILLRRGRYYDETRDDRHEIQEDEDRNEVNYTAVTG